MVLLSGILLGASFPPLPFSFLAYFAFVPLFILVEVIPKRTPEDKVFLPIKQLFIGFFRLMTFQFLWRKSRKPLTYERKTISGNAQVFRYTYATFFLWNASACHWLIISPLTSGEFGENIEVFVAGLIALLINPALMCLPFQFYSRMRNVFPPVFAAFSLAIFWICFEYLHFHWQLSWPWMTLGHSQAMYSSIIQYIEFTGVLGLSAHVLIANVIVYAILHYLNLWRAWQWQTVLIAVCWIAVPVAGSLFLPHKLSAEIQQVRVRVVQPGAPYDEQGFPLTREARVEKLINYSSAPGLDSIDLVVWPENAVPKPISRFRLHSEPLLAEARALVDSNWVSLLTGFQEVSWHYDPDSMPESAEPDLFVPGRYVDIFSSAAVLPGDSLRTVQRKAHPVPFVERIPFLRQLSFLKKWDLNPAEMFPSMGVADTNELLNLSRPPAKFAVGFTFEGLFGDEIRQRIGTQAGFLALLTDGSHWNGSYGARQHAIFEHLRGIENRRDMIHCAVEGPSYIKNRFGQWKSGLAQGETGWADGIIEVNEDQTIYNRRGDYLGVFSGYLTLGLVLAGLIRARIRKRREMMPREM